MSLNSTLPSSVEPPLTVIEPVPGWRAVNFAELWQYRELLFFLTWRDVKVRYKQTVLGVAWAVLQPVMAMVIFTVFFGGWASSISSPPHPIRCSSSPG